VEWLEARQRQQAWEDTLRDNHILVSEQHWSMGNWSSASGEAAFTELLRKYPQMDAVFVSNDQMALGVLHYAYAHGIRVPDDLAVVGFDDMAEAAYFSPALTSVRQPLRELGILAVKTLLAQIEGDTTTAAVRVITLQTGLIIRESTPRIH
jgi:LacI family transcriptional regulator